MLGGFFLVHRELFDKPIWLNSTPEHKCLLALIIGLANHEPAQWEWKGEKFKINPGQFITSLETLKVRCGKGVSIQNIRSALKRFEKLQFLTDESTKQGRLLTLVNWGLYQYPEKKTNKGTNKQPTKEQQRSNKAATTNNNNNNNNNDKKQTNSKFELNLDTDIKNIYDSSELLLFFNKNFSTKNSSLSKEAFGKLVSSCSKDYIRDVIKHMVKNKEKYTKNPVGFLVQAVKDKWAVN